jgi:hypothetical protein
MEITLSVASVDFIKLYYLWDGSPYLLYPQFFYKISFENTCQYLTEYSHPSVRFFNKIDLGMLKVSGLCYLEEEQNQMNC